MVKLNNNSYAAVPTDMSYGWREEAGLTVEQRWDVLEERREQLLELVQEDGRLTEELKAEWQALLTERDRVLRLRLKQENEQMLQEHMATLLQLLVSIGQFNHSSTPTAIKLALFNLYKLLAENPTITEVKWHYGSKENIPVPPPLPPSGNTAITTDEPDGGRVEDSISSPDSGVDHSPKDADNDSDLDLPDHACTLRNLSVLSISPSAVKRVKLDESDAEESALLPRSHSRSRCRKSRSPLTLRSTSKKLRRVRGSLRSKCTPRRPQASVTIATDLRRCILTGKDNLRSTPGVRRSPGGTPERAFKPVFASENPNDIICLALQKKFCNIRRLYGSPLREMDDKQDSREASFNLSID